MAAKGREQGQLMQQAAADVHSAVGQMAERLNQLSSTVSEHQARQLESAQAQNRKFEEQLERITTSADGRQQSMDGRFRELMGGLTMQLEEQLGAAAERDQQRQMQFERLLSQSGTVQSALLEQITTTTQSQMRGVIEAGEEREQTRQQRFHEQLEGVSAQQQALLAGLGDAVQAAQQQSQQMAEQHQQLLSRLQQAAEAATESSKHMDSTANQLGMLSTNVRSAAELLGTRMEAVTQRIESAGMQNTELAEYVTRQSASMAELQSSLSAVAQRFEQAAADARNGFGEMGRTQHEFLAGVRHEFTALGEVLRTQVEGIEKQAEAWLRSYSTEVSQQLNERMMKWNEVSHSYADQMLHTAQAMSSILDELEAR
jgi:hypothetical protein